ncbi:MAG: DUF4350 domain-containing protein [Sphingomicrobium sp.]
MAAFALLALGCHSSATDAAKPELYLLTSLPLLFDEDFAPGPAKGAAATWLREHYRVKAIDLPSQLPPGTTLLAAQPRAIPAEELVALDSWVRAGGKMLLLADPMLEWPSKRPLGDRLRPPLAYADTGLLAHWGLRLDAPDRRGARQGAFGNFSIAYLSPGTLVQVGGDCDLSSDGSVAGCRLGRGHVTIVADADLLNVEASSDSSNNLPAVGAELLKLSARPK